MLALNNGAAKQQLAQAGTGDFMNQLTETISSILSAVDDFVWGPVMLILLVGTGAFLTIRTRALCWRNLPYALKSVLSKK